MRYCKGFKRNLSEMLFIEKKQNMLIVHCNIAMQTNTMNTMHIHCILILVLKSCASNILIKKSAFQCV